MYGEETLTFVAGRDRKQSLKDGSCRVESKKRAPRRAIFFPVFVALGRKRVSEVTFPHP
jgi:hypothetical protein